MARSLVRMLPLGTALLLAIGPVPGQTAEAPKTQTIQAVERGAFVQATLGGSYQVVSAVDAGFGGLVGIHFGYDLAPIFSVSVGGTAWSAGRTSQERILGQGDLLILAPTARLELALLTTQRLFFRIRAEGGYAFVQPSEIDGRTYGDGGPTVGGALGVEYYTKLRHFSVGLNAGALAVLDGVVPVDASGPATPVHVQIAPHVKYTF